MKKLKGPDLKMPDLKMPAFLTDLYYDLRDRRLLPLIALALVAIVAVPILLGGDSEEAYVPPPGAGAGGIESQAKSSKLTVVEATPGLRDYHKRLGDRSPTNPFKQRYTSLPDAAQLESTSASSSTAGAGGSDEVSVAGVEEEVAEETTTSPGGGEGSGGASQPLELVIDVQITRIEKTADGNEKTGEPEVRHDVPVLTQLPGKKTPVVTTMGANLRTERLVFLVSHEVKAVVGEFSCITRGEVCELLEVELGALLEFVYEPSGARYAIKVTNADVIPARKGRGARSSRAAFIGPAGAALPTP
jgi:hypothetical protein